MHKADLDDNFEYIEASTEKEKLTQELVERYIGSELKVGDNKLIVKLTPHGFYTLRYQKGYPIPNGLEGTFSTISALTATVKSFYSKREGIADAKQEKIDNEKAREQRQRKVEMYAKRESTKSGVELPERSVNGSEQA